jgi:lysozyme
MKQQIDLEPLHVIIRRFEGFRAKPYLCPAGVWTIGYGSTKNVTRTHPPVSVQQAEAMMRLDALEAHQTVTRISPVLQKYPEVACSIADFVYNLGAGRYLASTLRRKVDAEDWPGTCEQLTKWVWGGGRKLPGLVLRRQVEIALIQKHT